MKLLYQIVYLLYLLLMVVCVATVVSDVLKALHPLLHSVWTWGSAVFIVFYFINLITKNK